MDGPPVRWILRLLPVLAVVVAAAVWLLRPGSDVETLAAEEIPGYRVVYRVEDTTGETVQTRTEVLAVARPYSGRVENRPGPPPGGEVTTGRVTNREHLFMLDEGGRIRFGVLRPPGGPTRDASYRALTDAARDGRAEIVGSDEILDVACTIFAFADPTPQPLAPPTQESRIESCVSAGGIVLRETWTFDETTVRTIEAVEVDRTPPEEHFFAGVDPESSEVSQPEAADLIGTQVVASDEADPGPLRLQSSPPAGYELDRSAVVAERIEGAVPSQTLIEAFVGQAARTTGSAEQAAHPGGSEVVLVERSSAVGLDPSWDPEEGAVLELAELGQGRVVHFMDRVEVRMIGEWGYARVAAPSRATAMAFVDGLSLAEPDQTTR